MLELAPDVVRAAMREGPFEREALSLQLGRNVVWRGISPASRNEPQADSVSVWTNRMHSLRRRTFLGVLLGEAALAGEARAGDDADSLSPDYTQRQRARVDASTVVASDIEKVFPGATLLWRVPPNLLLSSERRPVWEYVEPDAFGLRSAQFSRLLTPREVAKLARESPDAICDPGGDWFAYRTIHAFGAKQKVLALPSSPAGMLVGMHRGAVPASVRARDFLPAAASRSRSLALLSRNKRFRVCLYAAYDHKTAELRQFSRTLCDAAWKLIARDDYVFSFGQTWCDGCAAPTYAEGVARVFGTFNMLTLALWPYPLLVSDVSTVESRNVELATFLEDGRFGRHLISQSFSGCPSLQAPPESD